MLMNGLTLAFPVALVTHNILKVLVTLYIVAANNVTGIAYDFIRDASLASYLNGKTGTGLAD